MATCVDGATFWRPAPIVGGDNYSVDFQSWIAYSYSSNPAWGVSKGMPEGPKYYLN